MRVFSCLLVVCFLAFNILESEGFDIRKCYNGEKPETPEKVPENLKELFPEFYKLLCCVFAGHITSPTCDKIMEAPKNATEKDYGQCFMEAGPKGACEKIHPNSTKEEADACLPELKKHLKENCCINKGPFFNPEKCWESVEDDECVRDGLKELYAKTMEILCHIYEDEDKPKECASLSNKSTKMDVFKCLHAVEGLEPCHGITPRCSQDHIDKCVEALEEVIEEYEES